MKFQQALWTNQRKWDLFGLSIPEEYGGLGLDMVGKCAILEEVGRTINGYTTVIGGHTGIGSVGIVELGNEEQKKKYLPDMASGESYWCLCFNRAKCRFTCS